MLTYQVTKKPGQPLYESLSRQIREDILSGALPAGEKLPSKRALAAQLHLGKTTVEAAYGQLLAEGLIVSREKSGFYVEAVPRREKRPTLPVSETPEKSAPKVDLTAANTPHFPFSVWIKLQREVILDYDKQLLLPLPSQGIPELRQAISDHLAAFRGMEVSPDRILVGAGTDFLYNLLIQLLGRNRCYGVEEPGYRKIRRIYAAAGADWKTVPMDGSGILPEKLGEASVAHISPAHHFPTGLVMPMSRRRALLDWVRRGDRYIIEDDYDWEFRFQSRPLPALAQMEEKRVIYINSFSKTLAPSIRISYLVLPEALAERFRRELGFYGGTVPSFEQYTLARFLSRGCFEKHLNRMRRFYTRQQAALVQLVEKRNSPLFSIQEQPAGLHFLLRLNTPLPDGELLKRLEEKGVRAQTLSSFYASPTPESAHQLVVNYSALEEGDFEKALEVIEGVCGEK